MLKRPLSPLPSFLAFVLVLAVCQPSSAQTPPQGSPDAILNLLPADVPAAVVIPNLKLMSDQLTQLLEGMDREQFLLGSRPIDQIKAVTGFNVGINDNAGLAIMMIDQREGQPKIATLVPVTDAQAFLDGNFAHRQDDQVRMPDGRVLHTRNLQTHVLLADDERVAREYRPGRETGRTLRASLGERAEAMLTSGEMFMFANEQALRWGTDAMNRHAADHGLPMAGANLPLLPSPDHVDMALISIDFDALGVISRSLVRFKAESPAAAVSPAAPRAALLNRLPMRPFYFAKSADLRAMGGEQGLQAMLHATGLRELGFGELPQWITQAHGFQFAAYATPEGAAGGLLSDAVLVVLTPNPQQTVQAIQQDMQRLQQGHAGVNFRVNWEAQRRVNEAIGTAAAYDVTPEQMPEDDFIFPLLWQNVFGPGGWRGFVHQTQDSVIITFSQRPAVLDRAIKARDEDSLRNMPAIRTMQTLMPANSAVQGYLGLAQIIQSLQQMLTAFGQQDLLPEIDAELPPIGFAAVMVERGVETAAVVPAPVLALLADVGIEQTNQIQGQLHDDVEDR